MHTHIYVNVSISIYIYLKPQSYQYLLFQTNTTEFVFIFSLSILTLRNLVPIIRNAFIYGISVLCMGPFSHCHCHCSSPTNAATLLLSREPGCHTVVSPHHKRTLSSPYSGTPLWTTTPSPPPARRSTLHGPSNGFWIELFMKEEGQRESEVLGYI